MVVCEDYQDHSASDSSSSFSGDDNSLRSQCSHSTATSATPSPRLSVTKDTLNPPVPQTGLHPSFKDSAASFSSFTSSLPPSDDLADEEVEYEVAPPEQEKYQPDATPSTSRDFAELFPSSRRLLIAHDDATTDGNMNLRIDTLVANAQGKLQKTILFHLKMNDLKTRSFSFRRHCRDSGREICRAAVKTPILADKNKPSVAHSIASVLSFRSRPEVKSTNPWGFRRHDSGYNSMCGDDDQSPVSPPSSRGASAAQTDSIIALDFSNYAHVEVKRLGATADKRYEFEYWGVRYVWQRKRLEQAEHPPIISYDLTRHKNNTLVARINPEMLTETQAQEEVKQGGWVSPSCMRILDEQIIQAAGDVSDVVVATGLIVLVDDSIRRRFHSSTIKQLVIPSPTASRHEGLFSPKRFIDEAFGRGKFASLGR